MRALESPSMMMAPTMMETTTVMMVTMGRVDDGR